MKAEDDSWKDECKLFSWKNKFKVSFVLALREFELAQLEVFSGDITSPILEVVTELLDCKSSDGGHEHYYWKLKNVLAGYIVYLENKTNQVQSIGPTLKDIDKEELINCIIKTKNMHSKKQTKFSTTLQETGTLVQENISKKFEILIKQCEDAKEKVELFKRRDLFECFVEELFAITLTFLDDLTEFAALHIGLILYECISVIRASLEENLLIQENTLKKMKKEREDSILRLRLELYEKRKDWVLYSRCHFPTQEEIKEIDSSIEKTEKILQDHQNFNYTYIDHLERSTHYFRACLTSLEEILGTIHWTENACKTIQDIHERTLKSYEAQRKATLECHCRDGPLRESFTNSAIRSLDEKWTKFITEYEKQHNGFIAKKEEVIKSLITWLSVNGNTREVHSDSIGTFYLDEYGRKTYAKNNGRDLFSVNCDGGLEEIKQSNKQTYNKDGRYTEISGDKVYERAANSSRYRLGEHHAMVRTTEDCGHSEQVRSACARQLKDCNDVVRLPEITHVSMERTLNIEDVNYMWECVGPFLPQALFAVAKLKPNNPIHYLAHRLLFDKYTATEEEDQRNKKESEQFRANILAKRLEESVNIERMWKQAMMKSPAPKDIDDTQNIVAYGSLMQQCLFNALDDL